MHSQKVTCRPLSHSALSHSSKHRLSLVSISGVSLQNLGMYKSLYPVHMQTLVTRKTLHSASSATCPETWLCHAHSDSSFSTLSPLYGEGPLCTQPVFNSQTSELLPIFYYCQSATVTNPGHRLFHTNNCRVGTDLKREHARSQGTPICSLDREGQGALSKDCIDLLSLRNSGMRVCFYTALSTTEHVTNLGRSSYAYVPGEIPFL